MNEDRKLPRRTRTEDPRATMAVSSAMVTLRSLQAGLNYFLYSTELSYGLTLQRNDPRLADPEESVAVALSDVYASAWYPSNQGRLKYNAKVESFLDQLERNMGLVSRAVLVLWYSHFEVFLHERLDKHRRSWGPLTQTLALPQLRHASVPVRPRTVLTADLIRRVRNLIAHGAGALPDAKDDPNVIRWAENAATDLRKHWEIAAPERDVHEAVERVVGQVVNHLKAVQEANRRENIEHFYALFAFTNLDALAIEIEEALVPSIDAVDGRVTRKLAQIRRQDLIVPLG